MAYTGFGNTVVANPEDRQYVLAVDYHLGNNPTDATAGVQFFLPPGTQVVDGGVYTTSGSDTGAGGSVSVIDNQASPVSLFGTVADGNGSVQTVTVTAAGAGYTSAPAVAFAAPPAGGTQATGHAVESGGTVTSIVIDNPGSGYTAAPAVTLTGGGFTTTATATCTVSAIAAPGRTALAAYPYYPNGATLTVAPTGASAFIYIGYVVDGRANEVGVI